jgi:predicted Zn-dependent protease
MTSTVTSIRWKNNSYVHRRLMAHVLLRRTLLFQVLAKWHDITKFRMAEGSIMATRLLNQTIRRLTSAEGYLELNLPEFALAELERVTDPGELSVPVLWMKAEALKALGRYDEAIAPLRHVARSVPRPLRRQAWESLSECLKSAGRIASAGDAVATSGQFSVDSENGNTKTRLRLNLPTIGKVEVDISFADGLTISVRKVD